MLKIISNTSLDKVVDELLSSIDNVHFELFMLTNDLEHDQGKGYLNKRIGTAKFDKIFYVTLRDRYGRLLTGLITRALEVVRALKLDEQDFRDKLDNILNMPRIYDGSYTSWGGSSPDLDSMKLDMGQKNWWRSKRSKNK